MRIDKLHHPPAVAGQPPGHRVVFCDAPVLVERTLLVLRHVGLNQHEARLDRRSKLQLVLAEEHLPWNRSERLTPDPAVALGAIVEPMPLVVRNPFDVWG